MIVTLTGTVSEKLGEVVALDVGGVGYGILVASSDFGLLAEGQKAKLYIHEYIREDLHDLYGFLEQDTKLFFELLLSVNGVGPRMALHILSIGNVKEVAKAIAGGDTKFIQLAHGVGKRVAERIVVDLKDKVGIAGMEGSGSLLMGSVMASQDEAVQALLALGLTQADALRALDKVDKDLPTQERVKQVLKAGVL